MAFAKFTLSPEWQFSSEEEQEAAKRHREALCSEFNIPVHNWTPSTLTTNTNALLKTYVRSRPPILLRTSTEGQFPKYCDFYRVCSTRQRAQRASNVQELQPVLSVPELTLLHQKTH